MKKILIDKKFVWSIAAVVLGLVWFFYSIQVTSGQPIRTCCDSANYIAISESIHSLSSFFHFSGERTVGYPLFLAANRFFTHGIKIIGNDWVFVSEITSLLLFWVSMIFFLLEFSKRRPVPLIAWPVTLVPLGIIGFASAPLSDIFCLALIIFAFAFILSSLRGSVTQAALTSTFSGVFFALSILTRPSLMLAILPVAFLVAALQIGGSWRTLEPLRNKRLASGVLILFGLGITLLPQMMTSKKEFGVYALQSPNFVKISLLRSMPIGLRSPKISGRFTPTPLLLVYVDNFMDRHFGGATLDPEHIPLSFIKLALRNVVYMPLFFFKKMVGAFDNVDMNGFGAGVTPYFAQLLNQLSGSFGFLGFFVGLPYFFSDLRGRLTARNWADELIITAPFIFSALYLFSLVPFHIESRYMFPAWPFCTLALVLTFNRRRLPVFGLFAFFFVLQIYLWKDLIPIPYD